jgi:excisionase family DNA binding protein
MKSNLISASEAARRLNVHPKTVGRLLRLGRLTGLKIANRWVVEEATLAKFSRDYVGRRGWEKGKARKVKRHESGIVRKGK